MITIDWKERLKQDTADYLEHKLPQQNYDFEIIFNWYPERVQGHIPSEVILFVAREMAAKLSRNHEQYIAFYQYLWDKKGDYGKIVFMQFMTRFLPKKPLVYLPIIEKIMLKANVHDISAIFEKVFLPLVKKQADAYIMHFYKWMESGTEALRKQTTAFLIKVVKRNPELTSAVLKHLQNRWGYPLAEAIQTHVALLKALWKTDAKAVKDIYQEYHITRDPQTVEILCGAITDYSSELEQIVENWTHSGNARLKKAATSAYKLLQKKKA